MMKRTITVLQFKHNRKSSTLIDSQLQTYRLPSALQTPEVVKGLIKGRVVELTLDEKEPYEIKEIRLNPVVRPGVHDQTNGAAGRGGSQNQPARTQSFPQNRSETATAGGHGSSDERLSPKFLPEDTRALLRVHDEIDNYALKLQKYPLTGDKGKFVYYQKRDDKYNKPEIMRFKHQFNPSEIQATAIRLEESIRSLGFTINRLEARPSWRLVVGLGGASVYETAMTLHHVYGFPYIPGSAVKGVVRSWIIMNRFDADEKAALEDEDFVKVFGGEYSEPAKQAEFNVRNVKGKVHFFDAYPTKVPQITADVMNPHYSQYYSGLGAPADYSEPVPIQFLTVKETSFAFLLGIAPADNEVIRNGRFEELRIIDVASEWLEKALREHGIGAKTASGYGQMISR